MKDFSHPDRQGKAISNVNSALASTLIIARNEYKDVADVETVFGELPPVLCQIGELNQAFLNIIVNAAHAIADVATSRPRGLIRIATRQDERDAVIEIGDTGAGIAEDVQGRIFEPFFTTKEVGRGTGQGLAIARRSIVERHGGSLTFNTRAGQGTTFIIRIPIGDNGDGGEASLPRAVA
jgi:signal transduction histidine kinase